MCSGMCVRAVMVSRGRGKVTGWKEAPKGWVATWHSQDAVARWKLRLISSSWVWDRAAFMLKNRVMPEKQQQQKATGTA